MKTTRGPFSYKDLEKDEWAEMVILNEHLREKITELERKLGIARECLEFYGSPESWIIRDKHAWRKSSPKSHGDDEIIFNYQHPNRDWVGTVTVGGKKARQAIASIQAEGIS